MDSIPSLQHANPTTQLDVITKPAESALNPTVCVSYFTTLPKAQVQSCPVPVKKNEYFGPPGLQQNQLIHLSYHADKFSSHSSSSCLTQAW